MSNEKQPAQPESKIEDVQAEEMQIETEGTAPEGIVEDAAIENHSSELIAELEKKLAAAEAKVVEQRDGVLRNKAEMENVRRRATLDVEKAHKYALDKFANELLPVMDNMELALSHADRELEALKPMIEGIELTLKTMMTAVEKFGVLSVDPMGEQFDPNKHQAMSMIDDPKAKPNSVVAVMQKGYELNGRLLRPAMVVIAKAAPSKTVDLEA